jgi:hypothetical protein
VEIQSIFSSLFKAAERGDLSAADALFSALYCGSHRFAKGQLARQGFSVSLGLTTLLYQAYIEIAEGERISLPEESCPL